MDIDTTWNGQLNPCIVDLFKGKTKIKPFLQILDFKILGANKYKATLSDGLYTCTAVFISTLKEYIEKTFQDLGIIQIIEYEILLQAKVLAINQVIHIENLSHKIGLPTSIENILSSLISTPKEEKEKYYKNKPIQPIVSLNPYISSWVIQARITNKSLIKTWNNAKGSGKLFSIDLLDEEGGQIKCTIFNETAEKLYPVLIEDRVYYIGNGKVRAANKKFNNLSNDYEIYLETNSIVEVCDENINISHRQFKFIKIDQINSLPINSTIDVGGVIIHYTQLYHFNTKQNKELCKRNITIVDESNKSIDVTLWEQLASDFNEDIYASFPVIFLQNIRVTEYNNLSLSSNQSSKIILNEFDNPYYITLKNWYDNLDEKDKNFDSLSKSTQYNSIERKNNILKDIYDRDFNEKGDYLSFRARVTMINFNTDKPPWYESCCGENCNKKVTKDSDNQWFCDKCNMRYSHCEYRLILNLIIDDHSASSYITLFHEQALQLLGINQQTLQNIIQNQEIQQFKENFPKILFHSYNFNTRVAKIYVNEQFRIKVTAISITDTDFVKESKNLLDEILLYN